MHFLYERFSGVDFMGVQKDLEAAKKELEKVKTFVDKANVSEAKKAVEQLGKRLEVIAKSHLDKMKKGQEGIVKFDTAVEALLKIFQKTPFDGAKANDLIKQATTAAVVAATATKTD